ncbi:PEP-CTERM sorting domain-containing protein [Planctomyces sp. SH-PL62]|uniref:PEP-CTERM sorting domain-containing protein n=1 Tax=Planctomyces sp. SH-PL62 TaxID=1636152 RepID=UPI00078C2E4D|nr:PEP-CTERM sorting domain-containing protein [Planctomyces sp. SH-PL62]AMV36978.1 hypothetical protein VT85_06070 [Planctomyces sp. SH-PL62]
MNTKMQCMIRTDGAIGGRRRRLGLRPLAAACAVLALASAVEGRAGAVVTTIAPSSSGVLRYGQIPGGPTIVDLDLDPDSLVMGSDPRSSTEVSSAVKFALPPDAGPHSPITSAVFYLTLESAYPNFGDDPRFSVGVSRSDDGVVGLNDFWGVDLFLGSSGSLPFGSGMYEVYAFDATAYVHSAVVAGTPFVTLSIWHSGFGGGITLWNRGDRAPRLVIKTIPEPSSVLLAGIGLAGLFAARRVVRRPV